MVFLSFGAEEKWGRQIKVLWIPHVFSSSLMCEETGKRGNFWMLFPLNPCLLPSIIITFNLSFSNSFESNLSFLINIFRNGMRRYNRTTKWVVVCCE